MNDEPITLEMVAEWKLLLGAGEYESLALEAVPRLLAALAASKARYAAALEHGEQAQLAAEAAVGLLKDAGTALEIGYGYVNGRRADWLTQGNTRQVRSVDDDLAIIHSAMTRIDAFLAERAAR